MITTLQLYTLALTIHTQTAVTRNITILFNITYTQEFIQYPLHLSIKGSFYKVS